MTEPRFLNPYQPGAGHRPPHLAGRQKETLEFERLLQQEVILDNLVLTGLRGVGKTVLLDRWKPLAQGMGWSWVGDVLSQSASLSEERIAARLITDLSVWTSTIEVGREVVRELGFMAEETAKPITLNHRVLMAIFESSPGLVADKLKMVLETVWSAMKSRQGPRGIVFAYDEAQNLSDHESTGEFPSSLLLDVFQSLQKKGIPFMLALAGLPTLFPKLVEARTFAERMFRVLFLDHLDDEEARNAIKQPLADTHSPIVFSDEAVDTIVELSGGYPYFIQFICREVYDANFELYGDLIGGKPLEADFVPVPEITRKLDTDFFAGRWARATDRQREMLFVISQLETCDEEFSVQEIAELSQTLLDKPFSSSHTNQMLASLADHGIVFKNRHGKYSFAVPLMGRFIRRQHSHG